jgi:ABC-type nitrate/sulfonate/bicarbonate transport system substrate-binding protein
MQKSFTSRALWDKAHSLPAKPSLPFIPGLVTPARLQGADVVMVASFLDHFLSRLVVRPDIRTVGDLKGKRRGVTRFGTASDFGMRLMISQVEFKSR